MNASVRRNDNDRDERNSSCTIEMQEMKPASQDAREDTHNDTANTTANVGVPANHAHNFDFQMERTEPPSNSLTAALHQKLSMSQSFGSMVSSGDALQNRILLTSGNHSVIHWNGNSGDGEDAQAQNILSPDDHAAPYHHYHHAPLDLQPQLNMVAALLLDTLLAWFSASDAKNHCVSHEAYAVYDMLDDDGVASQTNSEEARLQEQMESECKQVFLWVMIPVCATTFVLGIYAYAKVKLFPKEYATTVEQERASSRLCIHLLVVASCISLAWSYGIVAVMLWPRYFNTLGQTSNPYQSLAAVDFLGNVGDNANLYYTSWIGLALSVALVYQIFSHVILQHRKTRFAEHEEASFNNRGNVEAMLASSYSTSQQNLQSLRESRATWYNSIYKLRARTGVWMAALLVTVVVVASSLHVFKQVLYPTAVAIVTGNNANDDFDHHFGGLREICGLIQKKGPAVGIPAEMCARTSFAFCAAAVAAIMQGMAIVLHLLARQDAAAVAENDQTCSALPYLTSDQLPHHSRGANRHIPLKWEFVLSVVLSNLLGLNAVLCTGVQGPAAKVGNLYYASWLSFLLCLRICLGCLEELYHIKDEKELQKKKQITRPKNARQSSLESENSMLSSGDMPATIAVVSARDKTQQDLLETQRAMRLRSYFFLGVFSTVCFCAGLDAAYNQASDLSSSQKFMIIGPAIVAVMSAGQFLLCLYATTYLIVSRFWIGGVLSILAFGLWLFDLILTMQTKSSWAVNAIGDIKMANLYYFTWASIITAGMQMMSYTKDKVGFIDKDLMILVWLGINKVCFVIIGAGLHIWRTISDSCGIEEIQSGAVTFCSRTVFAIFVGLFGMLVGSLVLLSRFLELAGCCGCSRRMRAYVEAVIALFLVVLFGVAVAIITGIGGPGQSVGDLYYASWLAFVVAIGVGVNCYDQLRLEELETAVRESNTRQSVTERTIVSEIPFVHM